MANIYDTAPAGSLVAVTPSDSTIYTAPFRGLWVGTGGNVAIKTPGATAAVTLVNVPDGYLLAVKAEYVMSTNTTASDIVGMR